MVAAAIRSVFEQPDETSASEQLRRVADGLSARFPAVADLLLEAEADLLVHFTFPEAHRRQIRSTDESVKSRSRVTLGRGRSPRRRAGFRGCQPCRAAGASAPESRSPVAAPASR